MQIGFFWISLLPVAYVFSMPQFFLQSMAPKKKSPTVASSSSSTYDANQFQSANQAMQFAELYAKRNVGSEREINDKLLDKPVVYLLTCRPWGYLMKYDTTEILVDWVREFFNNMDVVSAAEVKTYVRGTWFNITPMEIGELLDIPVLAEFDYHVSSNTQGNIDYDVVATTQCGRQTRWVDRVLQHGRLKAEYRFLNLFVCYNLEPRSHTSDGSKKNAYLICHWDRQNDKCATGYPSGNDEASDYREKCNSAIWSSD